MPTQAEISGVTLSYVAREVQGDVMTTRTKYIKSRGENQHEEVKVKDPIIVFFPNKTCQVLPKEIAQEKGFLKQPTVLNFAQVQDSETPAGRYKNAIREEDRKNAWIELENGVIRECEGRGGHPFPIKEDEKGMTYTATYSKQSLYLG